MHFNLSSFASREQVTHRAAGEHRRVAVAAEMAEHDTLDLSRQELFQDEGGRGV